MFVTTLLDGRMQCLSSWQRSGTVQLCLRALLLSCLLALRDIMLLSIYVSAFINPLFCVYSDVKSTHRKT